jgi:uroporphyrinogen decarboxylase
MNKLERINAALTGNNLDRLPFSFWYHFGLQHTSAEQLAQAHLSFFHAYDLDFLKVMNDYPYPASDNQDIFSSVDDWKGLQIYSGDEGGFGEQLKALRIIAKELSGEAYFVETIFSPWTIARRLSDAQTLLSLKRTDPELLLDIMYKIAESLANYARQAIAAGAAGIFLSLSAATNNILTYPEYQKFCRPFDLMVLGAIQTNFNILHIHGQQIFFDELLDYPVQAINWSHMHTRPTLIEARAKYAGCLLGGIDEEPFSHNTVHTIEHQIKQTIESVGNKHLIIAPGCSIQTDSAPKLLQTVKRAVLQSQERIYRVV